MYSELCTYIWKSSVILLDSLNSFIRSSLHIKDCTWTSPTKSGQETRELSLVQKAVKYITCDSTQGTEGSKHQTGTLHYETLHVTQHKGQK